MQKLLYKYFKPIDDYLHNKIIEKGNFIIKVTNIVWDTEDDGKIFNAKDLKLPIEIEIPEMDEDDIADWLSNKYGWCVENFIVEKEEIKEIEV